LYSYREAQKNLEQWNSHPRRVNNHTHVKRMTDKVGAVLSEHNGLSPSPEEWAAPAQDLILQVDGGHIPIQEQDKRSFEALAAIVYRPEHLHAVDQHHRQSMEKPVSSRLWMISYTRSKRLWSTPPKSKAYPRIPR